MNTKIGPVLEVTTSYLQGKYGVEIRIESVNIDNSHSWVRISHGLNKLVTDLIDKKYDDNEQETSATKTEALALKSNARAFASRSKAKAKPETRTLASPSTRTLPIGERKWTDVEPEDYSPVDYSVSKQLSTLLRHGHLPGEDDGAIEFWRIKEFLRNEFENFRHWSDEKRKSRMAKGGGNKNILHYCTDPSGQEILYLRALQGHSGRNLVHPSFQDNVLIPNDFFEHIYHIGCAINLQSIMNSGLIPGGQKFEQKTDGILHVCGSNEQGTEDPEEINLNAPRLAWYKQKVWKKHQNTVYWIDIKLAQRKGLKFYQTRCNAIILHDTLPTYCIPKAIMMKSGQVIYEKVYASPRPPPKISFKDNWMKEFGSEVAGGGKDSQQPNQRSKIQLLEQGDLFCQSNNPVRVFRKSKMFLT